MSGAAFSELIHSPVRLRICALLRRAEDLEFGMIRDTLEISDAHLSKNLRLLADADLVALHKDSVTETGRKRTWVRLTPEGRAAVDAHLAALAQIAAGDVT